MAPPADRRRGYLGRQLGTLALSHVRAASPLAPVRAASWHNVAAAAGVYPPLFVVHDLGVLFTAPRGAGGWALGAPADLAARVGAPAEVAEALRRYAELLGWIAGSEVVERAAGWRLRDDLVGALILRVLGDVWQRWAWRGKGAGGGTLPLDPELYAGADPTTLLRDYDARPLWDFVGHLAAHAWHVYTCVEQIDLDTVRLLGLFGRGDTDRAGAALELPDLLQALASTDAASVVDFSLELLPSVLETKRASGAQTFAVDGYSSIERRGAPDSLVLSELAHDDELFERKVVDAELYYYGREKEREEERRLEYVLVDASASMRGERQVFARGLALALAKKLSLTGDEVWLRFFDSRLYDVVKATRGAIGVPYLLSFRSERGRHYGKVFRQLLLELTRLKREARREIVLYIVTHGQCHVPVELVAALKGLARLCAVIILPSSEVALDWLPLCDRHHVVSGEALASPTERRGRALDILDDVERAPRGSARG